MVSGDRTDLQGGQGYFADRAVAGIPDKKISRSVGGYAIGVGHLCAGSRGSVAHEGTGAVARVGSDRIGGENQLAYAAVIRIGDEQIPFGIGRDTAGKV